MGFEVFEKGSAPISTVPAVTIQKRGLISLNRAAHELVGEPEAVELLWDAERRVIGFRKSSRESPNAYPVRAQTAASSRGPLLIAGNLFTRHIDLDTSQARRWIPYMEDSILCIDISQPGQKVSSNRNRTSRTPTEPPRAEPSNAEVE